MEFQLFEHTYVKQLFHVKRVSCELLETLKDSNRVSHVKDASLIELQNAQRYAKEHLRTLKEKCIHDPQDGLCVCVSHDNIADYCKHQWAGIHTSVGMASMKRVRNQLNVTRVTSMVYSWRCALR